MKNITQKVCYVATGAAILLLALSCGGRKVADNPNLHLQEWDEGNQELTAIVHGIPVYDGAEVTYRRDGKPLLDVELHEPVLVSVASKPEKWGYFQFPGIYRSAAGALVAKWNMASDAVSSYGKRTPGFKLSSDNGKTWNSSDQPIPFGNGLLLPGSGDRISVRVPVALKASELQLPQPIASNKEAYGRTFTYYRLSELPEALQGVYLERWDKNGERSEIHAGLEDPRAVRHADDGLLPVVWKGDMKLLPDNSIIAGIYPMYYERETGGVDPSGVSFYRSTDNGMNWKFRGMIPYIPDPAVDPDGDKRLAMGYTEPAFEILSDGTFLCVMRTTDGYGNSPMYLSRSSDQGVTWSHPKAFTPSGVLPHLLQLDNGVLVLASGRPGVQIRFSIDGKGENWTDPFEMLPFSDEKEQVSCGYTGLLSTGPDSFMVIYSDFKYPDQNNEERKAIKIREIKVAKK